MSGIYLHIPFCKQACSYCDFYFVTRTKYKQKFVDALVDEIKSYSDSRYTEERVHTVYMGGGTPSLLSVDQLERIWEALQQTFPMSPKEITIEMNPDDVTAEYLASLHELGVNRASMGVQTFNPDLLSLMNRAHNRKEALKSLELLSESGFNTYTVDLIYGNPGQDVDSLDEDLQTLMKFDPPHISAYSLTIEPRTRLGKQLSLGRIEAAGDDMVVRHFERINEVFAGHHIHRYEVSNYCREGHRAVHNSNYWEHENFLGLGPSAHSFWWDDKAERGSNVKDLIKYISGDRVSGEMEHLSLHQLAEERLMMGLRTRARVPSEELLQRYDYRLQPRQLEYLEKKEQEGEVEFGDHLKLTDEGIKIADAIILDLVTLHPG